MSLVFRTASGAQAGDTLSRANGLYGDRAFISAPVVDKVVHRGRRSRQFHYLDIAHGGARLRAHVTADEYHAASVGQRRRWVTVPGRVEGTHVFIDRPGLKLDPKTRVAAFGLILGAHGLALFALFVWLVRRAERA